MKWQDKLAMLKRVQARIEYAQRPTASEISLDFMKEEIHPRLESTLTRLKSEGFEAELIPPTAEEIPMDNCSVYMSVSKGEKSILKFEEQPELKIDVTIFDKSGWSILGVFAIDREPEPPTTLVEGYIRDFVERLN